MNYITLLIKKLVSSLNHQYVNILLTLAFIGVFYILSLPLYIYIFFLGSCFFYTILYLWRKLPFTIISYFSFIINICIFYSFLFGIYSLYIGLPNPIFIENLSKISYYRYLGLLSITLIGIVIYLMFRNYPSINTVIDIISYPYLKEEMRKILRSWDNPFFGKYYSELLNFLFEYNNKYYYCIVHFILFYVIRLIQTLLFFNFAFNHGDLRWNIYLLPLSFIIWILRFFEYYFINFYEENLFYIKKLIIVSIKDVEIVDSVEPLNKQLSYLDYKISSFGISEGYTDKEVSSCFDVWVEYIKFNHTFKKYQRVVNKISIIILLLTILSWFNIFYIFDTNNFEIFGFSSFVFRRYFSVSNICCSPRTAHHVTERIQNTLRNKTKGQHGPGHPVYGEKKDGKFWAEGSMSHGPGSKQNPGEYLGRDPNTGEPIYKYPYDQPVPLELHDIKSEIPNTGDFLNDCKVKEMLDKPSSVDDK